MSVMLFDIERGEICLPNIVYRNLYNDAIVNKTRVIVIEYSSRCGTYHYIPYSHHASEEAVDDLAALIIDNMVFYAFSEDEIVDRHSRIGLLDDLRIAAKYAYTERLPKRLDPNSDGIMGEVLLDLILQVFVPHSQKLLARAKFREINSTNEIKGYDALYFTKNGEEIWMWLGQAKSGVESYCKNSIKDDLNTKYTADYFANTAFYIVDKCNSKELVSLINEIDAMCLECHKAQLNKREKVHRLLALLRERKVKVKIPCLLAYTKDIYTNETLLQSEIERIGSSIFDSFEGENFSIGIGLEFDLIFYIFPIKDVGSIRNQIVTLKRESGK
jgi:hypothetical protein